MERAGINRTGMALAYIKDGLDEIARTIDDYIIVENQDIVLGKREYDFPDGMIKLRKLLTKDSEGNYQQIPRITHGPHTEK